MDEINEESAHKYKITCIGCGKELENECIVKILEFIVEHKQCMIQSLLEKEKEVK